MHLVFVIIVSIFCADLNINTVIVQQSFCRSLNQLCDFSYVPSNMHSLVDPLTAQHLRDVAIKASKQNVKQSISEILQNLILLATVYKPIVKDISENQKFPIRKNTNIKKIIR